MLYLSDEWLTKANDSVSMLTPLDQALEVQFIVAGGPEGVRSYALCLGPEKVEVRTDFAKPNVTFELDWEVAVAIAQGERSAQRAFLDGSIALSGDTAQLVGHDTALVSAMDCLKSLREISIYD